MDDLELRRKIKDLEQKVSNLERMNGILKRLVVALSRNDNGKRGTH